MNKIKIHPQVFSTIRTVALERHRRFGLFLVIPVHVVQELASREIAVGDDDDDEDELHEEEVRCGF